jgi:dihydroorotate dehydrogenase
MSAMFAPPTIGGWGRKKKKKPFRSRVLASDARIFDCWRVVLYRFLRPFFFLLPPEVAHGLALAGLEAAWRTGLLRAPRGGTPVEVMGLRFPNRVGLAAGMDKDARHVGAWGALGFGFVEVGTVTPRPQSGNPRPRLFRLPAADALINRLGFNNEGAAAAAARLARHRSGGVVGVNIGKNATTPPDDAVEDFRQAMRMVYGVADYIAVNVSSPNTAGLRDWQAAAALDELLAALVAERERLAAEHGKVVPLALKLAPDLGAEGLAAAAATVARHPVAAVIATNTTIERSAVAGLPHGQERGGLSGAPLRKQSTDMVEALRQLLPASVAIIGVGGISSAADAREKIRAGADLVQIYTGLVYRGPGLVREIARGLAE